VLDDADIPLILSMFISSEVLSNFFKRVIGKCKEKVLLFTISLLDVSIQDGGKEERSNW